MVQYVHHDTIAALLVIQAHVFLCLEVCTFLEHAVTHRYSILVQIPESQASMLFKQNPWQREERKKNPKSLFF